MGIDEYVGVSGSETVVDLRVVKGGASANAVLDRLYIRILLPQMPTTAVKAKLMRLPRPLL